MIGRFVKETRSVYWDEQEVESTPFIQLILNSQASNSVKTHIPQRYRDQTITQKKQKHKPITATPKKKSMKSSTIQKHRFPRPQSPIRTNRTRPTPNMHIRLSPQNRYTRQTIIRRIPLIISRSWRRRIMDI